MDPQEKVTLFHIGGYELLRDGTQSETFTDVQSLREYLEDYEISYDKSITSLWKLAESAEAGWEESKDDGGGSGWIEYE